MTNEYAFDLAWSREDRAAIFDKLKEERLLKYMMYHMAHPDLEDWLAMTEPGDEVDVYKIMWRGQWCGIFYLSPSFNKVPLFHFAVFKAYRSRAVAIGCAATSYTFSMYEVPAVMGLTPTPFHHMFSTMRAGGWEILGSVPGACVMADRDGAEKIVDGVISVKRRD